MRTLEVIEMVGNTIVHSASRGGRGEAAEKFILSCEFII